MKCVIHHSWLACYQYTSFKSFRTLSDPNVDKRVQQSRPQSVSFNWVIHTHTHTLLRCMFSARIDSVCLSSIAIRQYVYCSMFGDDMMRVMRDVGQFYLVFMLLHWMFNNTAVFVAWQRHNTISYTHTHTHARHVRTWFCAILLLLISLNFIVKFAIRWEMQC